MSIEVEVFPTRSPKLTLSQIERTMRDLSFCRPALGITTDDRLLTTNVEATTTIDRGKLYFVPFGCRSLTLSVWSLEGNELEHFRSHIHNISIDDLKQLAQQNARVGVYFNLDSKMARGRYETTMLLLLAAAIAKLTDGLIVLPDHPVENVPQGGYRWNVIMDLFRKYDGNAIEPMVTHELKRDVQ